MKKLFFALAFSLSLLSHAQQFVSFGTSTKAETPERTVVNTPDGVIISYTFNGATIKKDPLYPNSYRWRIQGFVENSKVSEPAYLKKIDNVRIPEGMDAVVSVESVSGKYYDYELAPARPILVRNDKVGYNHNNVLPIASYTGLFPASPVESKGVGYYRGNGILNIAIYPIGYNQETKSVYAYDKISYKVTFVAKTQSRRRGVAATEDNEVKNDADEYLSNNTITNTDLIPAVKSVENNKSILFVTTSLLKPYVEKLAAWRNMTGYKTYIETSDEWTPDEVMATVKRNYKEHDIKYLIIFGDTKEVPGYPSRSQYDYYGEIISSVNDYAYGCMDGEDDYIADIHRGRISVSRTIDAEIAVNKIIKYEKTPVDDPTFWKSSLLCGEFQDEYDLNGEIKPDGIEDPAFILANEYIKNASDSWGMNSERIYYANTNLTPLYDNLGNPLSDELLKPNYAWNGGFKTVTNSVNAGKMFIVYNGHGTRSGWYRPTFNASHIKRCKNGDKLPFVFSFACNTGEYTNDILSFGETWLLAENAGGVGCLAPHSESFDVTDYSLATYIFYGITEDFVNGKFSTIGEYVDYGLDMQAEVNVDYDNLGLYTKDSYHYFGDPTMLMSSEMPTPFENVQMKVVDGVVTVTLPENTEATITLVDSVYGDVKSYIGNSATFTLSDPNTTSADICVYTHNKIPYIMHVVSGEISDIAYNNIERNININYNVKGANHVYVKIKKDGDVVCTSDLDTQNDHQTLHIQLKPTTYTVELCYEDIVLDSKVLEGASFFDMENDDFAGRVTVDYEISENVKNASIKMFLDGTIICSPEQSIALATKSIDLTSDCTGSVTFNTSLLPEGNYTFYLVEDGKYTYYSTIACNPDGIMPELVIEENTDSIISGKFKFFYGTRPQTAYIRFYDASLINNVLQHFVMMEVGKASAAYEFSLEDGRIDGTFSISTADLAEGNYYVVLYNGESIMPVTYTTVAVSKPATEIVEEESINNILAVSRVDGNLVIEYEVDETASSVTFYVNNTTNLQDANSVTFPVETTHGTVQIPVSSNESSDIYSVKMVVDGKEADTKKVEVQ